MKCKIYTTDRPLFTFPLFAVAALPSLRSKRSQFGCVRVPFPGEKCKNANPASAKRDKPRDHNRFLTSVRAPGDDCDRQTPLFLAQKLTFGPLPRSLAANFTCVSRFLALLNESLSLLCRVSVISFFRCWCSRVCASTPHTSRYVPRFWRNSGQFMTKTRHFSHPGLHLCPFQ